MFNENLTKIIKTNKIYYTTLKTHNKLDLPSAKN